MEYIAIRIRPDETIHQFIARTDGHHRVLENVGQPVNDLIKRSILLLSILSDQRYAADAMILRTIDSVVQDYASLRTALLARSLRDEHHVALTGHGAVNNVSLAAPRRSKHAKTPSIICNRCHKKGHKAAECRAPHPRSESKDDWRGGQQQKHAQNSDKLTLYLPPRP
jgi:hypothetical protein